MDEKKTALVQELFCPHCGAELEFELEENDQVTAEYPCPYCDKSINMKKLMNGSKQQQAGSADHFSLLTSILEFCPWEDAESAIEELHELGEQGAIPHIRPFLLCPDAACYRAALFTLENLGDETLLDHILAVLSDQTDRLPAVVSFLPHSSF